MKRNYLWIAATATILAGCTQNEFIRDSLSDETPEVISFDTYHSKATKAPIKEDANLIKQNNRNK